MDSEKFKRKFQTQCDTTHFRDRVRGIVRDETFFKDLIRDLNSHHQISNQVDSELKAKLPGEVNRVATPLVESRMNAFALYTLPQLVNTQISSHLDNSRQMGDILAKHSSNLELKLEAKSNEVMTKVVNEPKFNTLSNLHFQEVDRKNDAKTKEMELNLNKRFDNEIRPSLNQVSLLQTKLNNLESSHNFWVNSLIVLSVSILAGSCGWYYMNNRNSKGRRG